MRSQVSIVKCNNYQRREIEDAVRRSVELLGGISAFVKSSDRVLIKPNLLSASTPDSGIDTHPEFVRAVIRLVKQTGARIVLGDSPSVWGEIEEVDNVYEKSGMKQLALEEAVELVKFRQIKIKSGYPIASIVDECDCIISLPKFKTHDLMTMTGAVKNLFGFIPGLYKVELRKKALASWEMAKVLADIYSIVKPKLSIVDGIIAMEGDGPASGGILRNLGLILASCDAVALDSTMATIMGLKPSDILSTKEAADRGLGNAELKNIDIVGADLRDIIVSDYKLPQTSIVNRLPKPFLNVGKNLLHFRPSINRNKCTVCGLCLKACPVSAISIEKKQTKIDNKKCVLCLCCKEVCPQGAISVKKSLIAKMAGL
ncbi:MAG TPA: DUF362 domain-containing protein [Candidatus Omnitrophota bacterium]|nr:DUF362 domain-containing protein [Candidatus Omnitrophota bacterium]